MALSVGNRVQAVYQRYEAVLMALAYLLLGIPLLSMGISMQSGDVSPIPLFGTFGGVFLAIAAFRLWRREETLASTAGFLIGSTVVFGLYFGAGALAEGGHPTGPPAALAVWLGFPVVVYLVFRGGDS